jgi:hypothetical protein
MVVFVPDSDATSALAAVPDECRYGTGSGAADRCVVIDPAELAPGGGNAVAECPGGPEACLWRTPPPDQAPALAPGQSSVERVGVYLRLHRRWAILGLGPVGTAEVAAMVPMEVGRRVPT